MDRIKDTILSTELGYTADVPQTKTIPYLQKTIVGSRADQGFGVPVGAGAVSLDAPLSPGCVHHVPNGVERWESREGNEQIQRKQQRGSWEMEFKS